MPTQGVIKFDDIHAEAEEYHLPPDKLISGNPKQTAWTYYTDPSNRFFAGYWQSEIGKWNISYTEEEYCQMLEGKSVITDSAGHAVTVTAGDQFVIPRGFSGTWEVIETSKKLFVIYEAGA